MKFRLREEQALSAITALFEGFGYKKFKSGCFDEYSLYRDNESFLVGKNVITFTDTTGRLMAIRPDVTLSLVRRAEIDEGKTEKYFYNEMVYRRASGGRDFREIAQTGAEVLGVIDSLCEAELAVLMCRVLGIISQKFVLDISHTGYTEGLLKEFGEDGESVRQFLRKKDLHDFLKLAQQKNFAAKAVEAFKTAIALEGSDLSALDAAEKNSLNESMFSAVREVKKLVSRLSACGFGDRVNLNFSMANDADYYSGLVFNGYIEGVPHCVLTGGRYDNLLHKFKKKGGAIGFALYLGELERYFEDADSCVDLLIVYDDDTEDEALAYACGCKDKSVKLCRKGQESCSKAREIADLTLKGGRK